MPGGGLCRQGTAQCLWCQARHVGVRRQGGAIWPFPIAHDPDYLLANAASQRPRPGHVRRRMDATLGRTRMFVKTSLIVAAGVALALPLGVALAQSAD